MAVRTRTRPEGKGRWGRSFMSTTRSNRSLSTIPAEYSRLLEPKSGGERPPGGEARMHEQIAQHHVGHRREEIGQADQFEIKAQSH